MTENTATRTPRIEPLLTWDAEEYNNQVWTAQVAGFALITSGRF
jgi:hypothetical protein